ncbi:MAG: hypothetical protein Q8R13_03565 [bacterium]|nr:hypothetical protein [bacterium]MDZ4296143.1 hypothetical protein [Patescibacteria group bacterium]
MTQETEQKTVVIATGTDRREAVRTALTRRQPPQSGGLPRREIAFTFFCLATRGAGFRTTRWQKVSFFLQPSTFARSMRFRIINVWLFIQ